MPIAGLSRATDSCRQTLSIDATLRHASDRPGQHNPNRDYFRRRDATGHWARGGVGHAEEARVRTSGRERRDQPRGACEMQHGSGINSQTGLRRAHGETRGICQRRPCRVELHHKFAAAQEAGSLRKIRRSRRACDPHIVRRIQRDARANVGSRPAQKNAHGAAARQYPASHTRRRLRLPDTVLLPRVARQDVNPTVTIQLA